MAEELRPKHKTFHSLSSPGRLALAHIDRTPHLAVCRQNTMCYGTCARRSPAAEGKCDEDMGED
eukprot:2842764-Prymnesium_polylepis.1